MGREKKASVEDSHVRNTALLPQSSSKYILLYCNKWIVKKKASVEDSHVQNKNQAPSEPLTYRQRS
jgi:hypothetical protein